MCKHSKIIALLLFVTTCAFANWTGSTSEPANMKKIDGKSFYVITSADELAWFAAKVNSGSTDINAVLANDIVFGKDKKSIGSVSWTPIGTEYFYGVFDGAGYTIYGLYISTGTRCQENDLCAGLISRLGKGGVVKNVVMDKGEITVAQSSKSESFVGAIAGFSNGTIQNTENRNPITVIDSSLGTLYVGGIAGAGPTGTIANSKNSGRIRVKAKTSYSGGIVGYNSGEIDNCNNQGFVWSTDTTRKTLSTTEKVSEYISLFSGGIAGENWSIISNSRNNGVVLSEAYVYVTSAGGGEVFTDVESYSGGITGSNRGHVFKCYNEIEIYSKSSSVAVSGTSVSTSESSKPSIAGSASTKSISYSYSGGIGGYNEGTISNCYSDNAGKSSATGNAYYVISGNRSQSLGADIKSFDGGIVGQNVNKGRTKSSYYKTEYWLNNTKVTGTAENMQKDQFAWILNTCNGTEENSGAWTRGTEGYPTFANEDSLAIYKVVFDDDGATSNRYTNYNGVVTFPEDPEPAEGFVFSGWFNADDTKVKSSTVFTADQTVKAVYTDASDVFWTINFYNAAPADTILETKSYQHGSIVTYGGVEPTLAATAKYTYKFKGWDVEPTNAVEDFDYHAVYDSTIRSYTVVFNNSDGSKIESATFEYGKMPSCSKTPIRAATAEWEYTHKGWKPAIDIVTGEAAYAAIYDSVRVEYKVTFMNGTEVIDEQMVPYGDAAIAPTEVSREGYKFIGWNVSFAKITGDLTVKALFEELIIRTVNMVDGNGEKIDNQKIEDGKEYILPAAPKKEGFTFDGWYNDKGKLVGNPGDKITITEDLTLEAKYTAVSYTITFVNENGSKISSVEVAYGQMPTAPKDPTKASTAQYTYAFKVWNPTITSVTGAATYTAVFDSTLREYAVTFKNGTTTLQTSDVTYGTKPSYTGNTPTKSSTDKYTYTFKGWSPAIASVTGAATYTAVFDSTLRNYTIAFKNGTTTLQTGNVAYGTKPSYTGNAPTKASTDKYTYTFKGWSPTIASVTGAATYSAVFDSTLRKYTITFKNGTTTLQTSEVAYGTKPSYTGNAPTKTSTDKYTYTFKGWSPALASVTGVATYTAVFDSTLRKYTITFKNGTTTLQTSDVAYGTKPSYTGSTPTKKATNKYTYKFKGWNPAIAAVTKAATYQAVFDSTKVTGIVEGRLASLGLSVRAVSRSIQISAAPKNSTYAVFDMQGRILLKGRVESANFNIAVPQAGSYLVRVGNATRKVQVK